MRQIDGLVEMNEQVNIVDKRQIDIVSNAQAVLPVRGDQLHSTGWDVFLAHILQVELHIQFLPDHVDARGFDASFGLVFSQPVLLALVEAGMTRDDAYRIVQDNAMRAWDGEQSFRTLLEADTRVTVSAEVLDRAFDLDRSLQHVHRTVDALLAID